MVDQVNKTVLPVEVIFSCSVCRATLSEIYQSSDSDKGFRDGSNGDEQQPVTKLWLTECSHVTCTKHLDGGGVPFHRGGEQPRAICPVCKAQSGDEATKLLYAIRGFSEGEYDFKIPKEWFQTPPVKLGGKSKGMEAMTFHYLALARFGTSAVTELQKAKALTAEAQQQASEESTSRKYLDKQMKTLTQRIAELEQCERELKPWKDREPKIKFYLDLFPRITKENERLREQLMAMGYAVPNRSYSLRPNAAGDNLQDAHATTPLKPNTIEEPSHARTAPNNVFNFNPESENRPEQCTSSDRTLSGPGDPVTNIHVTQEDQSQPSRKRQREAIGHRPSELIQDPVRQVRGESRSLMPPPPLPVNRNLPTSLRDERFGKDRSQRKQEGYNSRQDLSGRHSQRHLGEVLSHEIRPRIHSQTLNSVSSAQRLAASPRTIIQPQNYDATPFRRSQGRNLHQELPWRSPDTQRSHQRKAENVDVYLEPEFSHQNNITSSHEHQFLQRPNHELHTNLAERAPLLEHDMSITNLPSYSYDGPNSIEKRHDQPIDHYVPSPSRNNLDQGPRTPLPFKRSALQNFSSLQPQSVASPFFYRQAGTQHSGRMTLSTPAFRSPAPIELRPSPTKHGGPQTPRLLSRMGKSFQSVPYYPQSTPHRGQANSTPQRQHLLTSKAAVMSNGLFRRPDLPSQSVNRPPTSPYFQSRIGNKASISASFPNFTPATPRSDHFHRSIHTLGSSTPSIRSNMILPPSQSQTSPRKHSTFFDREASLARPRGLTDYDLGYARAQEEAARRHDQAANATGVRSGVSRLSSEHSRDPPGSAARLGLESRGFGAARRSVRR